MVFGILLRKRIDVKRFVLGGDGRGLVAPFFVEFEAISPLISSYTHDVQQLGSTTEARNQALA